jgi:DNA-binding transcriptional ArsR family regulator
MASAAAVGGPEEAAPLFAALSDATRLRLMTRLSRQGPQSISALAEGATISRQAVTKHLQALEEAGLAESRRSGRERIFELRPGRLAVAQRYLDQIARGWDAALGRLRAYVEEETGEE